MTRLDELGLKLADDECNDEEVRELARLTEAPAARDRLVQLLEIEGQLHSASRSSVADKVVQRLSKERQLRVEEGVMRAVGEFAETQIRRQPSESVSGSRSSRWTTLAMLVGLTAVVAVAALLFTIEGRISTLPVVAHLILHDSAVLVSESSTTASRTVPPSEQPIPLRSGLGVETIGAMDSAEIVYQDGTTIELFGNTRVMLASAPSGAKQLQVTSGVIQADVAPQPADQPLQILTDSATLEVLGTTLGVKVAEESTQLEVTSGVVAVVRSADGRRVEVPEGQFVRATASAAEPLQPIPLPTLPDTWSQEFSSGLPSGWLAGQLESADGVPAVRAAPDGEGNEQNIAITTHNAWEQGDHALFQIHEDSVLHFRMRQEEFARIRLMVVARRFPPRKGEYGANLFYTRKAWNEDLPTGEWRTVSVPLRNVDWYAQRKQRRYGQPNLEGLAAYLIQLSTATQDAGLTIDRIWVTRDGDRSVTE